MGNPQRSLFSDEEERSTTTEMNFITSLLLIFWQRVLYNKVQSKIAVLAMTGGLNIMDVKLSKELLSSIEQHHDEIVRLYQTKNYSSQQIANELGFSKASIDRYRKLKNIRKLYEDKEWLEDKVKQGMSQVAIAKLCGCHTKPIAKYGQLFGLYEAKEKRQLKIKDDFFSTYNRKSCYWAGFINADGHIACNNRNIGNSKHEYMNITLSAKDVDHLKKFNKELTRENMIKEHETKTYDKNHKMCSLRVTRKSICHDLTNNFDIMPGKKSLNEMISDKIPKEYLRDFLRGHFDGDGSISTSNNRYALTIVGGKELCHSFKRIIDQEYNQDIGKVVQDSRNPDMYYYKVTSMKEIILIYLFMYYPNCFCLERKQEEFRKILRKI